MKKYIAITAIAAASIFGLSGCAFTDAILTEKVAVYDQAGNPVLNEDGTQKYIYTESALVTTIADTSKAAGGIWYWIGSAITVVAGVYTGFRNGKNKGLVVADAIAKGVDAYRDQLDTVKGGAVAGDKLVSAIQTAAAKNSVLKEVDTAIAAATTPDKVVNSQITFEQFTKEA